MCSAGCSAGRQQVFREKPPGQHLNLVSLQIYIDSALKLRRRVAPGFVFVLAGYQGYHFLVEAGRSDCIIVPFVARTHARSPARPLARPPARTPARAPARPPARPPSRTHARPLARTPARTPARSPARPPARPHARPHARTLASTHARQHARSLARMHANSFQSLAYFGAQCL